jgi:protein-disulfide isomerase
VAGLSVAGVDVVGGAGGAAAGVAPVPAPPGHRLGPDDAPATVLLFGTYECLHCRRAWPAVRALADAGLARVEWRHFAPPGAFPHAAAQAGAAEAAAAHGAFWAVHEALLDAPAPLGPATVDRVLAAAAAGFGLDAARLRADARSPVVLSRVAAHHDAGIALGVRATPSAFLVRHGRPPEPLDARDVDALRARVAAAGAG